MWTLPLRTHVNKTTEKSFQNLPLHTGSLLDSSLVVKIAPGCGGVGEGAGWKRRLVGWFGLHWHMKASLRSTHLPPAASALSLCAGEWGEGQASLVIKSFLCHRDPSQWPGCGAAG